MLKFFFYTSVICILTISCGSTAQPSYRSYAVKQGETVNSIAEDNNLSADVIYNLNPDSRNGLKPNSVIILPSTKGDIIKPTDKASKEHKVKRKETLYGIAKMYNVSVDDIKKMNKELYSRELKTGETILIPSPIKDNIKNPNIGIPPGTEEYTVMPKDTKYGIARKFGITLAELEDLNPNLEDVLSVNTKLIVPTKKVIETGEIDTDTFEFYEVKAKEGFYRLKVKFGLSEEEIIALNPYAKDGLKEGMILKVPTAKGDLSKEDISTIDLEKKITNKKTKNIALMLPFRLMRSGSDSIAGREEFLKRDPTLRIALDFYSGALMAAEFAKEHGISVSLNVYDTENSESKINSIISNDDFKNTDAVIGPLLQKNVEKTSKLLSKVKVPVFSPLSNRDLDMNPNLFQTLPTNAVLQNLMLDYLKENSVGKNVIIISDSKQQSQRDMITAAVPSAKSVSLRNDYIRAADISTHISDGIDNWVVLASDNPVLVSSAVNVLADMSNSNKIRLFTLDKSDAYEWHEVSSTRLANLNFTFPSVTRSSGEEKNEPFTISYKNKYGVLPNRFAMRGFDVTYDVLLRLASENDIYDAILPTNVTNYVDNKFRYEETDRGGYHNLAGYILKYNKDLKFEIVE